MRIHAFVVREIFLFFSFFKVALFLLILLEVIVVFFLLLFIVPRTIVATATGRWLAILVWGIPTGRRWTDTGLFTTSS